MRATARNRQTDTQQHTPPYQDNADKNHNRLNRIESFFVFHGFSIPRPPFRVGASKRQRERSGVPDLPEPAWKRRAVRGSGRVPAAGCDTEQGRTTLARRRGEGADPAPPL